MPQGREVSEEQPWGQGGGRERAAGAAGRRRVGVGEHGSEAVQTPAQRVGVCGVAVRELADLCGQPSCLAQAPPQGRYGAPNKAILKLTWERKNGRGARQF